MQKYLAIDAGLTGVVLNDAIAIRLPANHLMAGAACLIARTLEFVHVTRHVA